MKLITIKQVCDLLGLSRATIYRLVADPRAKFPSPVKVGRSSRWKADAIERYITNLKPQ